MKKIIFIFLVPAILCTATALAKGHGGGGHGGGRGGGYGHSGGNRTGGQIGTHSAARNPAARTAGRTTRNIVNRTTASRVPGTNQVNGLRGGVRNTMTTGPRNTITGTPVPINPYEHYNSYPYYYYGSYSPYYDPYFSMWSFGLDFMYTPHYYSPATTGYSNDEYSNNNNEPSNNSGSMQGFVVFERDTIAGEITISKNAISLETADTARGYDYKFKMKQQGLQYVVVYDNNDTNNRLDLVRLKGGSKKLMRLVHDGKLNVYDGRTGFIYRPEDIDVSTITVVYEGKEDAIHSASVGKTKEWLTDYVNKAYSLDLKPKDFTWKELLIYIDKLD